MNNIEEYKHLFVSVEERLPEKNLNVIVISGENLFNAYLNIENKWRYKDVFYDIQVTHWLDLSILTTKERSIELTAKAYAEGIDRALYLSKKWKGDNIPRDFENFINQNKYSL